MAPNDQEQDDSTPEWSSFLFIFECLNPLDYVCKESRVVSLCYLSFNFSIHEYSSDKGHVDLKLSFYLNFDSCIQLIN